jgi:hypothetical protein
VDVLSNRFDVAKRKSFSQFSSYPDIITLLDTWTAGTTEGNLAELVYAKLIIRCECPTLRIAHAVGGTICGNHYRDAT